MSATAEPTVATGDTTIAADDAYKPSLWERITPDNALARWAVYLVIVAAVAAVLWYAVFPQLQHLLPEGF